MPRGSLRQGDGWTVESDSWKRASTHWLSMIVINSCNNLWLGTFFYCFLTTNFMAFDGLVIWGSCVVCGFGSLLGLRTSLYLGVAHLLGPRVWIKIIKVISRWYPSHMLHVWNIYEYLPTLSYIYPKNGPNVGTYSIHGACGLSIKGSTSFEYVESQWIRRNFAARSFWRLGAQLRYQDLGGTLGRLAMETMAHL